MIDFLSMSISDFILIFLATSVLIFFCLYLYNDNTKLKEQIEELRKENRSLLEKKIMNQESFDSISIKNISQEKSNIDLNEKLNINIKPEEEYIKEEIKNTYSYYNTKETPKPNFNINEFISKNNVPSKKEPSIKKEISNNDYLKELSNKLSEEIKPQTIELTDYEKKQEEQAVISYKELLKYKTNEEIINDKEDTLNFIEELKNLRNSLD